MTVDVRRRHFQSSQRILRLRDQSSVAPQGAGATIRFVSGSLYHEVPQLVEAREVCWRRMST